MKKFGVSLQIHSVREDFAENPFETIKKIAAMGYEGIEFLYGSRQGYPAEKFRDALTESGLVCHSTMIGWQEALDELDDVIAYVKVLNCPKIVIGSVPFDRLKEEGKAAADEFVETMKAVNEKVKAAGLVSGYHAHDGDYTNVIDGEPFYEYVLANTPKDFVMMVDTGNMQAGGGDPIACIKRFPGRTQILHIKGYNQNTKYTTPVWESELDWVELFNTAKNVGATEVFTIEFGARAEYIPLERAELSCKWLKEWVAKISD